MTEKTSINVFTPEEATKRANEWIQNYDKDESNVLQILNKVKKITETNGSCREYLIPHKMAAKRTIEILKEMKWKLRYHEAQKIKTTYYFEKWYVTW